MSSLLPAAGGVPRRAIALGLFVVASLAAGLLAYTQGWIHPELIQRTVAESGSLAMVAYVISVVVLELLWVPRAWGLFATILACGGPVFPICLSYALRTKRAARSPTAPSPSPKTSFFSGVPSTSERKYPRTTPPTSAASGKA